MKNIILLICMLSAQQQCNDSNDLKLLSATSQSWSGGAAAMRGVYYNVYVHITTGADYSFDSLWVDGKRLSVEIKKLKAIDTLTLMANDRMGVKMPGADTILLKSVEAKFPIESKAEALLGYFYKGTRQYLPIATFQKLKPLAYP